PLSFYSRQERSSRHRPSRTAGRLNKTANDEALHTKLHPEVVMPEHGALVGIRAPDFRLPCTQGLGSERCDLSLADFQERWLILDPNGVLQYQAIHNLSVGRRSEEILRILDALQTGGLCPENWTPEEAPLNVQAVLGPNHVLGPYRIEATLGSGAFGTVFRA